MQKAIDAKDSKIQKTDQLHQSSLEQIHQQNEELEDSIASLSLKLKNERETYESREKLVKEEHQHEINEIKALAKQKESANMQQEQLIKE